MFIEEERSIFAVVHKLHNRQNRQFGDFLGLGLNILGQ